jgi:hypothetical protein
MRSLLAAALPAAALVTLTVCAALPKAAVAAQQPAPQPPATQTPSQPAPGQPPGQKDPAQPPGTAPVQGGRVLASDAGVIFFPVKPERTADFEKVMAKLKEALAASDDPVRQEQAEGWKVFKAVEPGPNNTALYVFIIEPAVKGSDYAFWKALYDAFPEEVQALYRLYTAATAGGQTLLNLQLVQDFKTPD